MGSISISGDWQAPKVHKVAVNGSQCLIGLRAISDLLYSLPLKFSQSQCWYIMPHIKRAQSIGFTLNFKVKCRKWMTLKL